MRWLAVIVLALLGLVEFLVRVLATVPLLCVPCVFMPEYLVGFCWRLAQGVALEGTEQP